MIGKAIKKIRRIYVRKVFYPYSHVRGIWRMRRVFDKLVESVSEKSKKPLFDPFEKEWDNLLILDACRLDLYEEVEGETGGRTSLGSSTAEFVEENFSEGDFSDIVYVTGNPHFSNKMFSELTGRDPDETFHEVFHTYMSDWDEEQGTVLPGPLIRDAKTAKKLFPDKKLVVHFMQPHHPFVKSEIEGDEAKIGKNGDEVWSRLEKGEFSDKEIWKAYMENLEFILEEVEEFIAGLDGRTVITSDHGNAVGESTFYGHPKGVNTKELREVPYELISRK